MNHCKSINSSELFGAGQVVVVQWAFRASFDENNSMKAARVIRSCGSLIQNNQPKDIENLRGTEGTIESGDIYCVCMFVTSLTLQRAICCI